MVLITRKNNGGITTLNNGQATTWNAGATAVDLGGVFDKDIDITSTNGSMIGFSSFDGIGTYFRSLFAPSEFNDASRGQYGDSISSEFVSSLSSFQTSMRVSNGTDTNYFVVEPTTLYSNQYPNTRDESGPYRPRNVLYTDDSGYFRSSSLPGFWAELKPADSSWTNLSASTFATGTMTSSGLYTANAGITVATGNLTISNGNITAMRSILSATNTIVESLTQSLTGSSDRSIISATTTWNTTGIPTAWYLNVTDTASNANSLLIDLQRGGVSQFKVNKFGQGTINQMTIGTLSMSSNSIIPSINGYVLLNTGRTWFFANSSASNTYLRINESSSTATSGAMSPVVASMGFAPTSGTATMTSFLVNSVINQTGGANGIVRGVYVNPTLTAAADFRAISTNVASGTGRRAMSHEGTASTFQAGKETFDATNTAAGTTGDQTINKPSGTVNFAAAATTLVVTNSMCATTSIVYASIRTNDATAVIKNVVPGAGTFTINLSSAATAETSVGFILYN